MFGSKRKKGEIPFKLPREVIESLDIWRGSTISDETRESLITKTLDWNKSVLESEKQFGLKMELFQGESNILSYSLGLLLVLAGLTHFGIVGNPMIKNQFLEALGLSQSYYLSRLCFFGIILLYLVFNYWLFFAIGYLYLLSSFFEAGLIFILCIVLILFPLLFYIVRREKRLDKMKKAEFARAAINNEIDNYLRTGSIKG